MSGPNKMGSKRIRSLLPRLSAQWRDGGVWLHRRLAAVLSPASGIARRTQGNSDFYYPIDWMLDLITNPQGDQVHITYQSDMENATDPDQSKSYPRDIVPGDDRVGLPRLRQRQARSVRARPAQSVASPLPRQFAASHHTVARLHQLAHRLQHRRDGALRRSDGITGANRLDAPLVEWHLRPQRRQCADQQYGNGGGYNGSSVEYGARLPVQL